MLKIILVYTVGYVYYNLFADPDNEIHTSLLWAFNYGYTFALCIWGSINRRNGIAYLFVSVLFLYGVVYELLQICKGDYIEHLNKSYYGACYLTMISLFILLIVLKFKIIRKWLRDLKSNYRLY